jgi:integrase
MRGQGAVYRRPNSRCLWIRYSLRGKLYRESTGTEDQKHAEKFLRHRLKEVGADQLGARKFIGPKADKVSVGELLEALDKDYSIRGKATSQFVAHLKPIHAYFGDRRAMDVTEEMIDDYIQERLAEGKAPATINRGTQLLGQAFKLGRKKVGEGPEIRKLSEKDNVREGFFDRADFDALVRELPEDLQDFARFGFLTGWRKGEIASLSWADLDMDARIMRLRGQESKNGEPRKVALEGELLDMFERRWVARQCEGPNGESALSPLVFHRNGKPVKDFDKVWKSACKRTGLKGKLFHDLRRSAARNMRRAGVSEEVAMKITGHKTNTMLKRYNITDENDLREAILRTQEYLKTGPRERKIVPFPMASGGDSN